MKKLFLTGIAALLLATGTAHAAEDTRKCIWRCALVHTPSEEQEAEAERCCKRWPNAPHCNGDYTRAMSLPRVCEIASSCQHKMRRANTVKDKPETTMTRFFIAGIAALFLATGTAHARPWAVFHCGKDLDMTVAWLPPKYFDDHKEHYFDFSDGEYSRRLPSRLFRWKVYRVKVDGELRRGSSLFYKGKKCEEFEDEEYGEW